MPPANHPAYHKDEKVFCFHHEILYEAKILDVRLSDASDKKSPHEYLVHYKGWKNTWDDWVMDDRLRKLTDENRELAASLRRDVEAATRPKITKPTGKRRGGSDASSLRDSEERNSSAAPTRGTKRSRDTDLEKEENFNSRPAVKIAVPDKIKSLLVDDWENISKNNQLIPLPAKVPTNKILDLYLESEQAKYEVDQTDHDVLIEIVAGLREYFDKSLGRILLYRFEREQYHLLRKKWESGTEGFIDKGPGDVYGAEHLARLLVTLPELIAQTNLSQQSTNRLREELSKFSTWLSKNADHFFTSKYKQPSNHYVDKTNGIVDPEAPGTATSRRT